MARKTRVFILIKGLGPGGAEKLLVLGLPYLDRDRFDYEVGYLLPWKDALVPDFHKAEVPVFCLNQRKDYDLRVVPRLARLFRERRVDVLHLHLPYTGIVGRVAGKLSGVKAIIYTEHGLLEHHHRPTFWANRLTYSWNDAAIYVSEAVRQSVVKGYKVNGHLKMNTIYNGIDLEELARHRQESHSVRQEFGIPPEHKLVVQVANFNPQKRHQDLLKAAQMVLQQDPGVTFLLVGHGRLEPLMKEKARNLGIAANVVFAGFRFDAPRLMAAADLFALSSQFEGLPVSLLEAMAVGVPVVATCVGGVPEVVTDGVEGLLAEPLNPGQLAEKMLALLGNADLRRRLSENGLRRVREQFDVRRMVERTEALYAEVLARKEVA